MRSIIVKPPAVLFARIGFPVLVRHVFLVFLVGAGGLLAQTAPPPLVHLYLVALDPSGQPVKDLAANDFRITDQAKSQTVFFFRRLAEPSLSLGPHEYANRPNGVMPHATAILFDLLNEAQANRVDTWHILAKSIPQVEPGGPLYFYLLNLNGDLVPVHGIRPELGGNAAWLQTFEEDFDKAVKAANRARPAGIDREDRTKKTYHDLEVLANQLATLPGRSDIVWITSIMPSITNSLRCNGDWVDCGLYVAHTAVTLEHDGAAVNPVSLSGVVDPAAGYDLEQMALLTGGRTYFGEPIREVLQQLSRNSANAYEIAYAPEAQSWDNKFHRVRLTCERKGVKVQFKERYYALPDLRSALERQNEAIQAALYRPSDTSDIGLDVKVSPAANGVHLDIRIDPADLLLHEQDGKFAGAITMLLSERGSAEWSESGGLIFRPLADPAISNTNFDLTKEQHDLLMRNGIPISQYHVISAPTERVRIIVIDRNTNHVGSVTFPVR